MSTNKTHLFPEHCPHCDGPLDYLIYTYIDRSLVVEAVDLDGHSIEEYSRERAPSSTDGDGRFECPECEKEIKET